MQSLKDGEQALGMPRQRFIWPSFWEDIEVASLSPVERLLFIGLFSLADDEGRIVADPRYLKGNIFRYDEGITVEQVRAMRDRIAELLPRSVRLYTVDGRDYIALLRWHRWQRPQYPKPSTLPAPPKDNGSFAESSANDHGELCDERANDNGTFAPGMGRDGMDRDGMGEGVGEPPASESDDSSPGGSPTPPPALAEDPSGADATETERAILGELKRVRGYPFDFARDLEFIRTLAVDYPSVDLLEEAKKWRIYKLDKPLAKKSNPRSQFRNWCRIASERLARDSPRRVEQAPHWHYNDGGGPIPF